MSWTGHYVLTRYRIAIALIAVLGILRDAHAQDGIEQYIAQAESLYVRGNTAQPVQVLTPLLGEMTDEQAVRAYRILTLSRLQDSTMADAGTAVLRLLHHAPSYQPDPVSDPPAYVSFVSEIRSALASKPEERATCSSVLASASSRYLEGAYEEAEEALTECLNQQLLYLPESEYVPALRLQSLLHLRMGSIPEAIRSAGKLLRLKPDYTADPIQDPPAYLALVELLKSGAVR